MDQCMDADIIVNLEKVYARVITEALVGWKLVMIVNGVYTAPIMINGNYVGLTFDDVNASRVGYYIDRD